MRIGLDARMYRSGVAGIGRYSQNLIKNLLEIDRENQYILFMTNEDYREFTFRHSNSKSQILNTKQNPNYKIQITNIPHFSLAEQTKLSKVIEKENLDLMHFLNFNHPVRYKGKFIVTIHDLTLLFYPDTAKENNFIKNFGFKYVMKNAVEKSEKIIAVSENTKQDIVKKFHIPQSKIQKIYEAADDKHFSHPELDEGSPANAGTRTSREILRLTAQDDKPIILYVGQFRKHKNIRGLIEAFALLRKDIPSKLVLLGKVPENFAIENKDILSDIIMPGFVSDEDLAAWYKIASVFVFPSFYEGFGLPGLEAMAAGLAVAASERASLPEIYKDAAIYFDPFRPSDIADKIKMVLRNNKLRQGMIAKGKKIASQYSWRKTAEETLKVYKEILTEV